MAGEQWKPTNGGDAEYMEETCAECIHDAAYRDGTGDSCEIAAAMYRNMGDPAWIIGPDGYPFCKQFKRAEAIERVMERDAEKGK